MTPRPSPEGRKSVDQQLGRSAGGAAKLCLILFGLLLAAIIAEVGARVAGYSYPDFYRADASRGYSLRPGIEGWYRNEGESYVKINSDGLRDREHSISKPPGTLRIAVVGDSYTEALQVPLEASFWAVMETKLRECRALGANRIEVINFGVTGYGTAQELMTVRQHVWKYAPDIVLLAITTNTDITDNSRALKKKDRFPYFVYRDGKLVLDDSFQQSGSFRLSQSPLNRLAVLMRDHSRLIQALLLAARGARIWFATRRESDPSSIPAGATNTVPVSQELGIDNAIYRQPDDPVWLDAWRVTEGLIMQMRDEVKSRGVKFLVVTLSSGIQVYPQAQVRQSFMNRLGVDNLFYPDHRIKALCDREGISVITLAPQMQAYAEQNKVFLHGFGANIGNGHWNQLGHRLAGEWIAQKLCEGFLN